MIVRGQAQDDDLLQEKSGVSQTYRFRKGCYAKGLDAVGSQYSSRFYRAMTISISFDDTGHLFARSDLFLDFLYIEVEIRYIDLRPCGSEGFFIH